MTTSFCVHHVEKVTEVRIKGSEMREKAGHVSIKYETKDGETGDITLFSDDLLPFVSSFFVLFDKAERKYACEAERKYACEES